VRAYRVWSIFRQKDWAPAVLVEDKEAR